VDCSQTTLFLLWSQRNNAANSATKLAQETTSPKKRRTERADPLLAGSGPTLQVQLDELNIDSIPADDRSECLIQILFLLLCDEAIKNELAYHENPCENHVSSGALHAATETPIYGDQQWQ
jgi:hypothetical protein